MKLYKLTNEHNRTYNGTLWTPGEWHETSGEGDLCGPGWLHAYEDPLVAAFMNPAHADFSKPRLWLAKGDGKALRDGPLKIGVTRLRVIKRLAMPKPTRTQIVAFGILCAMEVCKDRAWRRWARRWLSGKDRSRESVAGAARAARATWAAAAAAAARSAEAAAARAAARAAAAASRAAEAAGKHPSLNLAAIARKAMKVGKK